MALAVLSIDLEARLAKLQTGLDQAARLAEKDAARMGQAFERVRSIAGGIGGALAAGLSVSAVTRFVASTNAALLSMKDLSEATGASIANISGLENVMRLTGGSVEDLTPILVKFNGALKDADGKNGISQALKAIGLDAAELRQIDPAEALLQVSLALQGYADDGNKARLVQELFGKSIKEAGPFLHELAEAGRLNATVTRDQVEAADKFDKSLNRLKSNIQDVARGIVGPLVGSLNSLFAALKAPADLFDSFNDSAQKLIATYRLLALARERLTPLALLKDNPTDPYALRQLSDIDARARAILSPMQAARDAREAQYAAGKGRPANASGGRYLPSVGDIAGGGSSAAKAGRAAAELRDFVGPQMPDSLRDALRAIESTDIVKIAALRDELKQLISIKAAGGGGPGIDEALLDIEDALTRLDPAAQAAAERVKLLNRLLADTPAAKIEEATAEMALLRDELIRTTDPVLIEKLNEALDITAKKLQALPPEVEKLQEVNDLAKDLGLSFTSAFEDAIVGGKGLREVLAGLEQDILRIITRRLVTEPLAGGITSLLQGLGGDLLGSLFGGGGLPGFASVAGISGGRAGGGGVGSNSLHQVNEYGTELLSMGGRDYLLTGRLGGTVRPAGGSAGAISVNISQSFAPGTDRATIQQAALRTGQAVQRAMQRNG